MVERAFIFDCKTMEWVESFDEDVLRLDIEKLPTGLVWQNIDTGDKMKWDGAFSWWDEEHGVAQEIEEIAENGHFRVADGSEHSFLPGYFQVAEEERRPWRKPSSRYAANRLGESYDAPFRWRIRQESPSSPLLVTLDIMELRGKRRNFVDGIDRHKWRLYTFSAMAAARRMVSSPYSFFFSDNSSGKDEIQEAAPEGRIDDLPEIVGEAILSTLQESYASSWGMRPAITSAIAPNKAQVIAYIERPFDTNIVYLHNYLGAHFGQLVPREERDPYRRFMEALGVTPPPSLRKSYQKNPYAFTIWLLLQRAGFQDINVMRQFFDRQQFLGWDMHAFILDKELGYVRHSDKEGDRDVYDVLEVCSWMREERGETAAAHIMQKIFQALGSWTGWGGYAHVEYVQRDTFHYFLRSERILLEEETRQAFLHHGLTKEVHDMCVDDMDRVYNKKKYPREEISYSIDVQGWRGNVDGLDFALPSDTDALIDLGRKFHNCVASYRSRALEGRSIIVYAKIQDDYAICIEVADMKIVQALGPCNQPLNRPLKAILRHWASNCGIQVRGDLDA